MGSPGPPSDPGSFLKFKPFEFLKKVKFGGVVGKKTAIAVVVLIVLSIAIGFLHGFMWAILAVAVLAVIVCFGAFWSIDKTVATYADRSLMEGDQLLALIKAEMATAKRKGVVDIKPAIANPRHSPPTLLEATRAKDEDEEEQ